MRWEYRHTPEQLHYLSTCTENGVDILFKIMIRKENIKCNMYSKFISNQDSVSFADIDAFMDHSEREVEG